MKNIDSLSKTTSISPNYEKVKKYGIIAGAVLIVCLALCAFFVIRGNANILDVNTDRFASASELASNDLECILLSQECVILELDEEALVQATASPSGFQNTIVWKTSDETVATVDRGRIRAVAPGIALVTASSADGACTAKCQVIVQKTADESSCEISDKSLSLAPGETATLQIYRMPSRAVDSTVYWTSSNENVASVASNGFVEAKNFGTSVISAASRKDNSVIATCIVSVRSALESVSLSDTSMTLSVGSTFTLIPTIKPDNCTNKTVKWESSNTAVASVSSTGVVTGVALGTANITCTTVDGEKKATCTVTVQPKVEKLVIDDDEIFLSLNERKSVSAYVWPETISDRSVVWSSSNTSVVSIDEKGAMMGIGYGTATITAAAKANRSITDTVKVTVAKRVTGIFLDQTSLSLWVGESEELSETVYPTDAGDLSVEWSTDNDAIAAVDSSGNVTAIAAGTATIHCRTKDGSFDATCKVTVSAPVSSVSFNKSSIVLTVGQTYGEELSYTVTPTEAKANVKCYSNDSTIASVADYSGRLTVKGLNIGETKIVVETTDNASKRYTMTVYVNESGYDAYTTTDTGNNTLQITGLKSDWQSKVTTNPALIIPGMINGKKVTSIAANAFNGALSGITSVTISENITSIGANAFANNSAIASASLPTTLESIGNGAFEGTGLTAISIPKSCATIGNSAFKNCLNLISVNIRQGTTSIGEYAFSGAIHLSTVTIPDTVNSIGGYAFYNTGLTSVEFETEKLTEIAAYAFSMTNLVQIEVPSGVKYLRDGAFAGNAKLEYVILPDTVTTIQGKVFSTCTALKTVWMSEQLTEMKPSSLTGSSGSSIFAVDSEVVRDSLSALGIDPITRMVYKSQELLNGLR